MSENDDDDRTYMSPSWNEKELRKRLEKELAAKTKAVGEIVKSVSVLKTMLSNDGEYSICRSDHKTMELGEVLAVGDVLERISKAMDTLTAKEQEE
jgi:hypothetical protein